MLAPLLGVPAEDTRHGAFPLADPERDAVLIQSVAGAAAGLHPVRNDAHPRAEAFRAVQSFCSQR